MLALLALLCGAATADDVADSSADVQQDELISVIVPSFQRSAFLLFTLQEILLQQTYKNVEVIAIDDSPQCLTLHALQSVLPNEADREKVHYLCKNDRRYSIGEKRNMAVKESKGALLAFWDDDDAYPRFRLERQAAELRARSVDIVSLMFSHVLTLNETGSFLYEVSNPAHFGAHFGTLMLRRSVVSSARAVKFPDTSLAEDYAIVERALAMGYKFATMQMPWAYTRLGNDNAYKEFSVERVGGALHRVEQTPEWLPAETIEFFGAARELVVAQQGSGDAKQVVNRYPSDDVKEKIRRAKAAQMHARQDVGPNYFLYSDSLPGGYGGYAYESDSVLAGRSPSSDLPGFTDTSDNPDVEAGLIYQYAYIEIHAPVPPP